MKVGIPKEIKNHEYRVAITPSGVHELVQHGHDVYIETDAGVGSSILNEDYVAAGPDWAVVRLDRAVTNHKALAIDHSAVSNGTKLVMIGHPSGLATKIAGGNTYVLDASPNGWFRSVSSALSMPPDWDALWVTAASITSAPTRAKTSPRAIVPVMPNSSTTRRIFALICAVRRNFMNFLRTPSRTRTRPQMTMISPARPTSQRPAMCCMAVAVMSC